MGGQCGAGWRLPVDAEGGDVPVALGAVLIRRQQDFVAMTCRVFSAGCL